MGTVLLLLNYDNLHCKLKGEKNPPLLISSYKIVVYTPAAVVFQITECTESYGDACIHKNEIRNTFVFFKVG